MCITTLIKQFSNNNFAAFVHEFQNNKANREFLANLKERNLVDNDSIIYMRENEDYFITKHLFLKYLLWLQGEGIFIQLNEILLNSDEIIPLEDFNKTSTYGFIYFILNERNNLVKIGKTTDLPNRYRSIHNTNEKMTKLLYYYLCDDIGNEEKILHNKFAYLHDHLEWFKCLDELLDFIKSLKGKIFICNIKLFVLII
jgi:hypothetical protein